MNQLKHIKLNIQMKTTDVRELRTAETTFDRTRKILARHLHTRKEKL